MNKNNDCYIPYKDTVSFSGILPELLKLFFSIAVSVFPIQQERIQGRDEAGGCGS